MMDEKDREIIQLLQDKFPLVSEPYKEIGDKIWMDEVSVISRIAKMIQDGAIRHFGPFFDSKKLGYIGCLAAVNVPDDRVEAVAAVINKFDEVTHNYLRDGVPNLWFTVIAQSAERRENICRNKKGSANRRNIDFSSKKNLQGSCQSIGVKHGFKNKKVLSELQDGFKLETKPFTRIAKELNTTEEEVIDIIKDSLNSGIVRRIGLAVRPEKIGFEENALIAWQVSQDKIEEVGEDLAKVNEISHCYERDCPPNWPYNLFTMVHAKSAQDLERLIEDIKIKHN